MASKPRPKSTDRSLPSAAVSCRRIWARHESSRPLPRRLCMADTHAPVQAWILDVSVGGVGLVTSEALDIGSLLMIELETQARAEPLKMLASVLYCQPTAEGEFRHGCQFVTPLSEQQLRDVLQ